MEIQATLRIMGEQLAPADVSGILGIEADEAHRAGDRRLTGEGRYSSTYKAGLWCFQSRAAATARLEEHLSHLLRFAEAHKAELSQFREQGATIDLLIGIFASEANLGLVLEPAIARQMGELDLALGLDIYCRADE